MGDVYSSEDAQLKRKDALKLLTEKITKDKDRLRRFEHEARVRRNRKRRA